VTKATTALIVAIVGIIAVAVVALLRPEALGETLSAVLAVAGTALGIGGAAAAAKAEPAPKKRKPPLSGLLVFLLVLFAGACTTTYQGTTGKTSIAPLGATGATTTLSVDGQTVCTASGTKVVLQVKEAMARRICEAHKANGCAWLAPPKRQAPPPADKREAAGQHPAAVGVHCVARTEPRGRAPGSPSWARASR